LSGTARAIGEQHGEAMRDAIRDVLERYEAFLRATQPEMLALSPVLDGMSTLFDPATLDELHGIAAGAGVPFRHLVAYNLDAALFPAYAAGCTQAVVLGAENGGQLVHLANEDSPLLLHLGGSLPRTIQIRRRTDAPDASRRVVCFSVAGQVSGPNGANDLGLTITSTTLLDGAQHQGGLPQGTPHSAIVKRALEEATSIDQALALVRGARRTGRWSVLVSDADRDDAAYFEYDGAVALREERVNGALVTSNHALGGPARGHVVPEHSRLRMERAKALLDAEKPISVERAKVILRDREDLGRGRAVRCATMNTVCRVDNVMSVVFEPRARRFHVTDRTTPSGGDDAAQFLTLAYGRGRSERAVKAGSPSCANVRATSCPHDARGSDRRVDRRSMAHARGRARAADRGRARGI
jgi:hypothetical protein